MLKRLIRVSSAVAVVILVVLAGLQAIMTQLSYPRSADVSATVFYASSGTPRAQVLEDMARLGREHSLEIMLITTAQDDYLHGVDVYSLGAGQPTQPEPITWLDPTRHGTLHPASGLGTTNLNALYALRGSSDGIAAFDRWTEAQGLRATWRPFWNAVAANTLQLYTGLAYAAVVILLVALTMAWYAARAESRAIRLLAGTAPLRIQAQDLIGLGHLVLPPALLTAVASIVALAIGRGVVNALLVGSLLAAYLAAAVLIVSGCGVALSVLTWPQVDRLARRDPPVARFALVGELLKAVTFTLALASLPATLAVIGSSISIADSQARAAALREHYTVAIGGVTSSEYDGMVQPMGRFVADSDRAGLVSFAGTALTKESPGWQAVTSAGYDCVLLVNTAYLEAFGVQAEAGTATATDVSSSDITASIGLWLRQRPESLDRNGLAMRRLVSDAGLPVPTSDDRGFVFCRRPLLLVTSSISSSLSDDSLASFITSGEVLFRNPETAAELARRDGVSSVVSGFSRVTDYALMLANLSRQTAWVMAVSVVVLAAAVTVCTVVAAHVFATRSSRRIFAARTYGRSWLETLGRRFLGQAVVTVAAFSVASAAYLLAGLAWSPWLLVGLAAYLVLVAALDVRASQAAFSRVAARLH